MRLGPVGCSEDGAGAQLQPLSAKPQPLTTALSLLWGVALPPSRSPSPVRDPRGLLCTPRAQRNMGTVRAAGLGDIPGGN